MQLVSRDGAIHEIPDDQAPAAVQSGEFGFIKGQDVHVATADGQIGKVAPEHAISVLSQEGNRIATPEEVHAAKLEAKYGGIGSTLAAGGEGLARGLSLGASDPLAVGTARLFGGDEAAEATRKHLEEEQEAHSVLSTATQLVGGIAPIALTGGAAAPEEAAMLGAKAAAGAADAVRTLGFIPRAVDAAGTFAEELAAKLGATGADTVLGKAAQGAVKTAARSIVEGGLYAGGDEVSGATLKNEPLTVEHLLTAMGHGALLAGAVGGGLGALGPLASAAVSKVADLAEGPMAKLADEQYIRALSTNKKSLITEAKERFGSLDPIANRIREEGIVGAGDSPEQIAKKATRADADALEGLQDSVKKVGATGVRLGDVLESLEARASKFDGELGKESAAEAIRQQADNLVRIYGGTSHPGPALMDTEIPFVDLLKQRRSLEGTINWQTDSVIAQGRKAAGRTIEDAITAAGDKAAEELGDSAGVWKKEYEEAKRRFSETRWIKDVTDDAMDAKIRNRFVSPSDYGVGLSSLAALAHNPAGALMAIGAGLGHKVLRERGNATLAVLLDKIGTFEGLSEAQADVTGRIGAALAAALSAKGTGRGSSSIPKEDMSEARYGRELARVQQLAAVSPAVLSSHLQEQTAALATHAPGLAKGVQKKAQDGLAFLASKAPPPANTNATLTPHLTSDTASAQSRAQFLRYVDAVEGGAPHILRKLSHGSMTLEDAEVLQKVYPATFAHVQTEITKMCADRKAPLPFQTAMRLGILMDAPTCPELEPGFLAAQAALIPPPQPTAGSPAPKPQKGRPSASVDIADSERGTFERASAA